MQWWEHSLPPRCGPIAGLVLLVRHYALRGFSPGSLAFPCHQFALLYNLDLQCSILVECFFPLALHRDIFMR